MQPIPSRLLGRSIALLGLASAPLGAEVVFSESFESPAVSGFNSGTVPDNGHWIGASNGFGAGNRGLYNESVAWPATPPFSTPFGDQAYRMNYSNAALTTDEGLLGTITAGQTYTLTFHNAVTLDGSGAYRVELVAFSPGDARNDGRGSRPGAVVGEATGTVTTMDMSNIETITFTPDGSNSHLGKDLAVRLIGRTGHSVVYDNLRVIIGHDLNPSPADGEDLTAGGDVTLSWANLPPNAPATDTPVDVWFGDDPGNLAQVVDGALTASTVVNAPTAGSWYWRVDSYPDGDPEGTPVTGQVFVFTINDTDGDGLPDVYELANTDPSSNTDLDPASDLDGDNLNAGDEYLYGTDPNAPDSDGDTLLDGDELVGVGNRPVTSPVNPDTDGDGLSDGVETNTGVWVDASDTGTNPVGVDWDKDGLLDGAETNTGVLVDRFDTGTDPFNPNTDGDNAGDWYEVCGSLTDPHSPAEISPIPYPLPDPDPADTGAAGKPVKVYILSGQSNMVGYGQVTGSEPGTLDTITKTENKFPNLLDAGGSYLPRQDVHYRGVISATGKAPLAPGFGRSSTSIGPELGFGQVMGWFHDEPVLIIKASVGNRGLQWDFLPPGSNQFDYAPNGLTYPGYGESPRRWTTGTTPVPINWYAGKEFDRFFLHKDDWAPAGASSAQDPNVVTVLDDWANEYPDWAAQGFEIAGFGWFHGFDDANGTNGPEAERYEQNMVRFIKELRAYYEDRYPGKGGANAPFVASTFIQGGPSRTARAIQVADALLNISGDAGNYPEFLGNVKTHESIEYWRGGDESPDGDGIHHHWNAETFMLVGDGMGRAMLTLQNDLAPPFPVTFAIDPTAVDATTVGMVATPATDPSGPVEYFFENITGGTSSGWITGTRWDDTGLAPGSYDYRFRVRDAEGNESDWSATVAASPAADTTPPAPDPMSFASPPTATGEESITMTAATASDINGVEYEFICTVGGGPGSGWLADPQYTATGLTAGIEYTWVVRARDAIGNMTGDSAPASATTDAPDTSAPTPNPMSFDVPPTATGENSISMTATTASDPSGVEYEFECTVGGGPSSGWQDDPTYQATGLVPGTEYTYTVRARDKSPAQTATAPSAPASATTEAPDTTAPAVVSYSPAQGATGVPLDGSLVLTFDEDIAIGAGNITLKKISDGSTIVIDVTDTTQVSVSGANLNLDPTSSLEIEAVYGVLVDAAAVADLVGNGFGGISDDALWRFTTVDPPAVGLVFFDDFESGANDATVDPTPGSYSQTPDVDAAQSDGNTSGAYNSTLWVKANQGFGSGRQGLVDESHGDFTDPVGEQAHAFRYTNSGITTAEGLIGPLTAGTTYTVTFDVVMDGANDGTSYNARLVTFNGAARNDVRNNTGATSTLATASGNAGGTAYESVSLEYTADGSESSLGHDVAIRFFGATTSATIDNVRVTTSGIGGGGNTFADWIDTFDVGGLTGFDDDPDGDQLGNGLENYFGTDPGEFSTGIVAGAKTGNTFIFTHPLADSPADDLSASYFWSSDLGAFHADGSSADGTTVTFSQEFVSGGGVEVTATVIGDPLERLFVIIEATQTE